MECTAQGTRFTRQFFSSPVDQVIVAAGALKFLVRVGVLNDGGTINTTSNTVNVANADSVTILIAAESQ